MDWKKQIPALCRGRIDVRFASKESGAPLPPGSSKFGGRPDVPAGFSWPYFTTDTYDDRETRPRPLAFLAQFDCGELGPLDSEGLLPKTGLLSFFYELDSMKWGFDPKDEGCIRVYWFQGEALAPAEFPENLRPEFRLPQLPTELSAGRDAPDFLDACPALCYDWTANEYRSFDQTRRELGFPYQENRTQLLGWPDIIQNNMTLECELVSQGYYLGGSWEGIPMEDRDSLRWSSVQEWQLLLQMDTVTAGDFELMFGDCGRIYFYIRKEDLLARRFDRVWLLLQCS